MSACHAGIRQPRSPFDVAVHIVLDDVGKFGRCYREIDEADASFDIVVYGLLTGQYTSPVRVIALNTAEGWARDVSEAVARLASKRRHSS